MSIRIILADDHKIIRDGLRSLLAKQHDMEVVAEAEDGRTAVQLARELSPTVIVMDIAMPDLNGVEATRQVLDADPSIKVVALSMQSDGPVVRRMFQAGASGYLLKDCAFEELVKAIRTVLTGRTYLSPDIAGVVVRNLSSPEPSMASPLTAKEREVLQLIAEGKSTKEIAAVLSVSVKTIDTHRQHIMDKLDIHNVAELTRYAIREGLTSADARPRK
ncbi:MAG TPA: response regulator transcription factor [Tepidisphaeraceae bacterium]